MTPFRGLAGAPLIFLPGTTTPRLPHLSWFSKEPALSLVEGCALASR
jgi:hypothetical protein